MPIKSKPRPVKTKTRAHQRKGFQSRTVKSSQSPTQRGEKNNVTKNTKPLPLPDLEANIRQKIDEKISQYLSHFDDYLKEGENSISQIDKDLNERLFILLIIASGVDTPSSTIAKLIPCAKDQAVEALCSASKTINDFLIQLADRKNVPAAEAIWDNGVQMVSAIKTLAQKQPCLLKLKARKAIYMPSFRAKVNKFSDDFHQVSTDIELSRDVPLKTGAKAFYDLNRLVTRYLIKILSEAEEKRKLLSGVDYFLDELHKDKKYPAGHTREKYLLNLPGIRPEHLGLLNLPPYSKASAKLWWKNFIKPHLDLPETLKQIEGTELYKFLSTGAKYPVDYEIRDFFKKLCERTVLQSLAP